MRLIMNADDFGLTESVNLAIVDCFEAGIVQATTIMMNQPGTEHAIELYKQGKVKEVGLHFTVTSGKPLSPASQVASLVDSDSYFLPKKALFHKHDVNEQEIELELNAQYQAALEAGININHIDSHHFAGIFPPFKSAFTKVANEIGLPVRRTDMFVSGIGGLKVTTTDAFSVEFYDQGVEEAKFKALLLQYKQQMPKGVLELMCHPSQAVTDELTALSSYVEKRVDEYRILTSPSMKAWLEEQEIQCIGFDALR